MPDADSQVTTDEAVNPGQLAYELGGVPLKVIGPDPVGVTRVRVLDDPAFEGKVPSFAELTKAVGQHQADPDWEHPDPAPLPPEKQAAIEADVRLEQLRQRVLDGGTLSSADGLEVLELALRLGRL